MSEHKKYIMAIVAGAIVSAALILSTMMYTSQVKSVKEDTKDVMTLSYEIMQDKLEHYISELDKCQTRSNVLKEDTLNKNKRKSSR